MEKTKQFKTYLVATAIGLVATVGLFAYEGAVTNNVDAKANPTTSLTVAKIYFGKKDGDMAHPLSGALSTESFLTNITDDKVSYTCLYASIYHNVDIPKYCTSLLLGNNNTGTNHIGTVTFNFLNNFKYQSVRINAKANENKDLIVNNKTYTVKNNWTNIDIYSCGTSIDSSITITSVIGNKEKSNPFTWISSIELHSASK